MTRKATAAVITRPNGQFLFKTIELDDLRSDEILVRIEASGICHTDITAPGYMPLPAVFGHEGAGVVEEVGSKVSRVRPGERVIISYPWCGVCPDCLAGRPYICEADLSFKGTRQDGSGTISFNGDPVYGAFFQQSSFSTYSITLERSVVPVSTGHPPEMLAAIPCGILTGAGAVFNVFKPGPKESLAVFGTGAVGLSAVMAGHAAGVSPLIAVDIVESRLNLALELGATHALNAKKGNIAARILKIAPRGVNFSLETSTNRQALTDAIACLSTEGQSGMVNVADEAASEVIDLLLWKAASLRGIILGSSIAAEFLPRLLELNRQGRFPYERLITTYKFSEINKAVKDSKSGKAIKPVLIMP